MNRVKTVMLLATLAALFLPIGQITGGRGDPVIAVAFALLMKFARIQRLAAMAGARAEIVV